jgi:hypothetical protein
MELLNKTIGYGLVGLGAVAFALALPTNPIQVNYAEIAKDPNQAIAQTSGTTLPTFTQEPNNLDLQNTLNQAEQPKRLKVTVSLSNPEDLKVVEGKRIQKGDVLSDRTKERLRLEAKRKQLNLAIQQMSLPIPDVSSLPEPNYEEELVALEKAKFNLTETERSLSQYPQSKFFDLGLSEVHEPNRIKEIATLKEKKINAEIDVQGALARLSSAKSKYQQLQYQHTLRLSQHQTDIQHQQYELTGLLSQLEKVEDDLTKIVAVRSPYYGRVRRINILEQKDGIISAEIIIDTKNN